MPRKPLTRIHVNMHVIRDNKNNGTNDPALTVKRLRKNIKCHEVIIPGPSKVVYRPDKPLNCGARCWLETHSDDIEVIIDDETYPIEAF